MKCADCNYYWKSEEDEWARCYFDEWYQPMDGEKAPCEEDETENEE